MEEYCFKKEWKCKVQNCGKGVDGHQRTFVHNNKRIYVSVGNYPENEKIIDKILVWSTCDKCEKASEPQVLCEGNISFIF